MTVMLGLYSYEALEKHIHERIDDFIENFAEFRGMMAFRRRINERV